MNIENTIIPKGTKKLVEIEFIDDVDQNEFLYSIFQGIPIGGGVIKVNILYLQTIEEIKERLIKASTELIKNM